MIAEGGGGLTHVVIAVEWVDVLDGFAVELGRKLLHESRRKYGARFELRVRTRLVIVLHLRVTSCSFKHTVQALVT